VKRVMVCVGLVLALAAPALAGRFSPITYKGRRREFGWVHRKYLHHRDTLTMFRGKPLDTQRHERAELEGGYVFQVLGPDEMLYREIGGGLRRLVHIAGVPVDLRWPEKRDNRGRFWYVGSFTYRSVNGRRRTVASYVPAIEVTREQFAEALARDELDLVIWERDLEWEKTHTSTRWIAHPDW